MDGKLCSLGEGGTGGKDLPVCTCMCGSAHDCRCMVNGSDAMVASSVLFIYHVGMAPTRPLSLNKSNYRMWVF